MHPGFKLLFSTTFLDPKLSLIYIPFQNIPILHYNLWLFWFLVWVLRSPPIIFLFSFPRIICPPPALIDHFFYCHNFSACLTRSSSQSAQNSSPPASSYFKRWFKTGNGISGLFGDFHFGCRIRSSAGLSLLLLFEMFQKFINNGTPLNQVSLLLTKNLPVTIVTFSEGGVPQIFLLYFYNVKFIFTLSTL